MSYDTRAVDFFLSENTAFVQDDSLEVEISFLLQNARPEDPRILNLLVERYGPEILCLVQSLLSLPRGESALQIAAQIFATARSSIQTFWGESSPRKWLFGLAIQFYWNYLRHPEKFTLTDSIEEPAFDRTARAQNPKDELEASLWEAIDGLPVRFRLALVLRYLYGLSLQEIADLLNEKPDQIDLELFSARSRLHALFPAGDRLYFNIHPDRLRQIEDYRNGLMDHDTAVQTGLVQHVSECEHCFAYADDLVECEEALVSALRSRWPLATLEPAVRSRLEAAARSISSQPRQRRFSAFPVRQILWTGAFLLVFAGLAWYLFQSGLDQQINVFEPEPETRLAGSRPVVRQALPEPLEISAVNLSQSGEEAGNGDVTPYIVHYEPDLSGDGTRLAFSSTGNFVGDSTRSDSMDVYIYNLMDGSVELAAPAGNRFGRWRSSPSISEDGRWVVYGSNELEGVDQGVYDWSRTGIYLFDHETGERSRIDVGLNGDAPDGDSYTPTISADGRWITFWSTSKNLLSEEDEFCVPAGMNQPCMDAFIYDRESRTTARIPVGRLVDDSLLSTEQLEISADGRWIPMTIYRTDQIAEEVGMDNPAGAFLYDRQSEVFTRVDLSNEGVPGEGVSYAASVSKDGRFVAFLSRTINVAQGDPDRTANVFVHDLVEEVTEQLTGPGKGILSFDYPSNFSSSGAGWGNTVDLSADGRYVTFLGSWEHTTGDEPGVCPSVMGLDVCNGVFVYDRETGTAKEVTVPGSNHLYLFANLSADGRWVTYVELMPSCDPFSDRPVCTEVWLYDRENEWTYPVTKGRYKLPEATQLPASNFATGRGPVSSMAFSPDGEILATASRNDTIRLWQPANGAQIGAMKSSSGAAITGLAFSPDGELLAAGLSDGRVDVWRVSDRSHPYTLDGHPGEILQIGFFSDGRLAARTARTIWIWQRQEDVFVRANRWEYTPGTVWRMALSPQNDWIATAENDDLVWLRQASSGEVLLRLRGHVVGLRGVALSPDGKYLAALLPDGLVDVWEIEPGEDGQISAAYVRTLSHPDEVLNIAFTPEGDFLATVTGPGELRMWNVETGVSFRPFYPNTGYNGVLAFNKDRMAAGVSTGLEQGEVYLAYLWEGLSSGKEPLFFENGETDGDLPMGSLPAYRTRQPGQGYTYIGKEILFEDLYQANQYTPFEIQAPTFLPTGFKFRMAQVYPTGAVSLHYDYLERPGGPPTASILVVQHPDTPGFPGYTVGASAQIQDVEIGDLPGEYVRGEWQSFTFGETDQGRFAWHWDSQSASQQLRWKDGEHLFAIHYRPLRTGEIEERYISKADLLEIADKMAPLDRPLSPEYLLSASILRNEYGCLLSAVRSGRSVSSRIMAGWDRSGECQLVFGDRNIQGLHLPFAGIDLNCDGRAERMEIQVLPGGLDSLPSYQLVLMEPSISGRYQPSWESSIPESGLDLFAQVEIRSSGRCERTLAMIVSSSGEKTTQVFRWDGEEMHQVNESAAEGLFSHGHDALPP
jgi:RNA polymerase sigma factor (sigma-70 family)